MTKWGPADLKTAVFSVELKESIHITLLAYSKDQRKHFNHKYTSF